MSGYSHQGVVYFAVVGDYVKIGYSSGRLETRMASLLTGRKLICPDDMDRTIKPAVLHTIPDCVMRDERRLHGLFAAHHVIGEWHRFDLAFIRHLEGLQYVTYAQTLKNQRRVRAALKRARSQSVAA